MRTEAEIIEEQEKVWLQLQTIKSKIQGFVRIYADDECDLRELYVQHDLLEGRLNGLKWVRGK